MKNWARRKMFFFIQYMSKLNLITSILKEHINPFHFILNFTLILLIHFRPNFRLRFLHSIPDLSSSMNYFEISFHFLPILCPQHCFKTHFKNYHFQFHTSIFHFRFHHRKRAFSSSSFLPISSIFTSIQLIFFLLPLLPLLSPFSVWLP